MAFDEDGRVVTSFGDSTLFQSGDLTLPPGAEPGGATVMPHGALALALPALALFRRLAPERMGVIILSAIVAHTGWHWMTERWEVLRQSEWPRLDAAGLVTMARWTAALLLALGAARLLANMWAGDCQHGWNYRRAVWRKRPADRQSRPTRAFYLKLES